MGGFSGDAGLAMGVIAGFGLAFVAPFLIRGLGPRAFALLALYPASLFAFFLGTPSSEFAWTWVESFGIDLALRVDGLARVFALLISGLGALILLYASGYFKPKPRLGRFAGSFVGFLAAMLGLVLSDDVISLFLFWELTSITSFLLIGFYHEEAESRTSANQAFLLTGAGGLAMFVGLLMLGAGQGTFRLSEMESAVRMPLAVPALLLVFAGCATKSAQFPFHFWLPNAMAAPTPVSAFLHSATMVKAGVFLLARTRPIFGEMDLWKPLLTGFGGVTVLAALVLMFWHRDLKKLLAYSTVSALGMLVFLLGQPGEYALKAFVSLLVAHALYKGAFFLLAGALDHETGTRDAFELRGLARKLPWTAATCALVALSAFGLAPFLGFLGKEYAILAAKDAWSWIVLLGFVLGGGIATCRVGVVPFLGREPSHPEAHDPGWAMRAGPLVLALGGLGIGVAVGALGPAFLSPMAQATADSDPGFKWTAVPKIDAAFATGLGLIVLSVLAGLRFRTTGRALPSLDQGWRKAVDAVPRLAAYPTNWIQQGKLRHSFALFFALIVLAGLGPVIAFGGLRFPAFEEAPRFHELALVMLAIAAAVAAVFSASRLAAISMLGISGTGIAILFLNFGAPDLALTQLITELLTIVIAVLVFHRLPRFRRLSTPSDRLRDGTIALGVGVTMGLLVAAIQTVPPSNEVASYYAAQSLEKAYGRNVVNTILVDFRAMDTLGEATVLALAALGVYALVRLRNPKEEDA